MAEPVYTFDRQSMRRISAAVQKSEGVKDRKGNKWYPVKGGGGGATLRIGKTTGEWAKGTDAKVELYNKSDRTPILDEDDDPVLSGTIHNLFADVGEKKWVAWIDGYLIAAECPDEVEEEGGG